jgi:signal transduction histidine kinase/CheY-like chemotaxis protein
MNGAWPRTTKALVIAAGLAALQALLALIGTHPLFIAGLAGLSTVVLLAMVLAARRSARDSGSAVSAMRATLDERTSALAAAHAELLAVVNAVPIPLLILNRDRTIQVQNRAAEHLFGRMAARSEDRQRHLQALEMRDATGKLLPDAELHGVRALRGIDVIGEEMQMLRPDGRRVMLLVSAASLRDAQGAVMGAATVYQDITRLRELDLMKDEFVSIVSHELRTPLTAIRGSLQLLLAEESSIPDPDNRQLLRVALRSCERLVRIINDMLDVSKIEAGRLRLSRTRLAVIDVVRHSIEGVRPLAEEASVRLIMDVPDSIGDIVADADRLTQAVVNLLSNAVKFAPATSAVEVRARDDGSAVGISVSDSGQGIHPDDISRLFQKFQQLDGSGTRRAGGTGLGLAITKGIVEEHGGTIAVESVVGEGTTFTLRLPRAPALERAAAEPAPSPDAGEAKAELVLIAEDDEESRLVIRRTIEAAGLRVIEAATGRDAIDLARRERPDVITLDLLMPDGDGWWVVEQLQADPTTAGIPVVIVTGADRAPPDVDGPILRKPFDRLELIGNVRGQLDGRPNASVLVADDDEDVRHVVRETLQRQGCRVVEASDGRMALELLRAETFDLVIVDLHMPHVHGHDIIRALRDPSVVRRVPIIVLSGSSGEQHSLQSLVLGASVFMAKPADARALAREVKRLLRG